MNCSNEDLKMLIKYAPGVYKRFRLFEERNKWNGFSISFRDTDHTYESFRWEVVGNNNHSFDEIRNEEQKLSEELASHCCICDSHHLVTVEEYHPKDSSIIFQRFCASCMGKRLYSYQKVIHYAKYNQWCLENKENPSIPNIKVRLLNDSNKMFYEKLENLYYSQEKLYVSNSVSKREQVRYAGIYLGIRDKDNKRVYEGDIVVGVIEDQYCSRKFWGMAYEHSPANNKDNNSAINYIWLEHGYNNLPSPLYLANSFEVVGNVITGNENEITQPQLNYYYKGWNVE